MPAAWQVHSGAADACIATRAAARAFGLGFVPLVSERYDLAIRRQHLDLPGIVACSIPSTGPATAESWKAWAGTTPKPPASGCCKRRAKNGDIIASPTSKTRGGVIDASRPLSQFL